MEILSSKETVTPKQYLISEQENNSDSLYPPNDQLTSNELQDVLSKNKYLENENIRLKSALEKSKQSRVDFHATQNKFTDHEVGEQKINELNQNLSYQELEQKFDTAFTALQELQKHKEIFETHYKGLSQDSNDKESQQKKFIKLESNHRPTLKVSTNLKMDDDDDDDDGSQTTNKIGENNGKAPDSPTPTASLTSEDWDDEKGNGIKSDSDETRDPEKSRTELEKDKLKVMKEEMQQQLEKSIEESNLEVNKLKAENKQIGEKIEMAQKEMKLRLEAQDQEYQRKMRRLSLAPYKEHNLYSDDPPYTEEELHLVHMTLKKWRRQRFVQMAETILSNAVILKEANVISKALDKKVLYQFTIVEDEPYTKPVSFWESTSALNEFCNNEDTSLHDSKKPCVGIKVIDKKNDVVYVWSLDKLKARLQEMRSLYNFIDRPQYSKHFNWKDPFYENSCPRHTFIGSASVGLTCLLWKTEHEHNIPVICRYSGEILGYCKVRIKFVAQIIDKPEDISSKLSIGSKVVFEIKILKLTGIKESQYSQVHVQYKLPFFGNVHPLIPEEHIYTTDPASDFGNKPIIFNYDQTLNMTVSPEMMEVLTSGMLTFEVFGRAKRCALEEIERWDDRDEQHNNGNGLSKNLISRLSEDELVAEEKHDVVAWVQVCELSPTGEYVAVQVHSQNSLDSGTFMLRQGLQRRIILKLSHNSGQQFSWNKITKMEIGRVRLLDGKGKLIEPPVQTDIQMSLVPSQNIQYDTDGTSMIVAQASWDSTLHDSIFLNRVTQSNSRVLLSLSWYVEAEKCVEPISFRMDIAVQMQCREARPPSKFIQLLSQSKVSWKTSGLFSVTLRPSRIRKVSELWRLNTANKYVRGEEFLGNWKPRGVSLIKDYKKIGELIRRLEAVEYTKQILAIHEARSDDDELVNRSNSDDLTRKTVTLWRKKWGIDKEIEISQELPHLKEPYQDVNTWRNSKPDKSVTQVRLIVKADTITKKGHLYTPENVGNWVKRWYILRRPYLYIYESQKEIEEQGIINLTSAKIDYNECTEEMLQRQNVFTIHTSSNSYILQAYTKQEMQDWITKISIITQPQ